MSGGSTSVDTSRQARGAAVGASLPQMRAGAMNGETLQARVTITNPQGFHLRPMAAFARRAAEFAGTVLVGKDDRRVNGKSIIELMSLFAEQGTELVVEVSSGSPEAAAALAALADILAAPSMDDDEPPVPPKG